VPVESLVPGDVVELAAGALVPADGLVLDCEGAQVNEALLTGEPYPVAKRPGACAGTMPTEASNALFSGTAVVAGAATMLVVATGGATRLGGVAAALAARRPATAFERGLRSLGLLPKTGFKYGSDFRVYERAAGAPHARFLVQPVGPSFGARWSELARAVRLAHGVRKRFALAEVGPEGGVRYLQVWWARP